MDCSFCNTTIERGTGKIYVKADGSILNFCSKKCEKNLLKLRRKPTKTLWIRKIKKDKTQVKNG